MANKIKTEAMNSTIIIIKIISENLEYIVEILLTNDYNRYKFTL